MQQERKKNIQIIHIDGKQIKITKLAFTYLLYELYMFFIQSSETNGIILPFIGLYFLQIIGGL